MDSSGLADRQPGHRSPRPLDGFRSSRWASVHPGSLRGTDARVPGADGGVCLADASLAADDHGRWSFVPAGAVTGELPTGADGLSGWSGAGLLPGALGHDADVLDLLYPADAAAVCRAGTRHGGRCVLARKKLDRLASSKVVGERQGKNGLRWLNSTYLRTAASPGASSEGGVPEAVLTAMAPWL